MKVISWKEVLDAVKADEEINFMAEAMTPLHALGIEALLLHLNNIGIKVKGFILAVEHCETGLAINDEMFHTDCYEGITIAQINTEDLEQKSNPWYYMSLGKDNVGGKPFYYATPFRPSFERIPQVMRIRNRDSLKVYITDEGTASYLANPYKLVKCDLVGMSLKNRLSFFVKNTLRDQFLEKRLIHTRRLERYLMYRPENGKWVPNKAYVSDVVKLYRAEQDDGDYSKYENSVVFASSLMYESGLITRRVDVEIFAEIQKILGDGEKYIVKPHPREKALEDYNVLNCEVEQTNKLSLEKILAHLARMPKCVIGDTGTALVNIAALYGIKVIAINKLIDRSTLFMESYFDEYNKTYDNLIFVPNNWDELRDCLKEL